MPTSAPVPAWRAMEFTYPFDKYEAMYESVLPLFVSVREAIGFLIAVNASVGVGTRAATAGAFTGPGDLGMSRAGRRRWGGRRRRGGEEKNCNWDGL